MHPSMVIATFQLKNFLKFLTWVLLLAAGNCNSRPQKHVSRGKTQEKAETLQHFESTLIIFKANF